MICRLLELTELTLMRCSFLLWFLATGEKSKYPTTPPPHKKHQTGQQGTAPPAGLMSDLSLTKSRSHESQLSNTEINQMGK